MRLTRLAVLAGVALFASATTAVEYADAQSRSGSRSSFSSSSRSSSSSYRSSPPPSRSTPPPRSYSAPAPARTAEPRPIRAVAPPTPARPVTRDAAAPRPIRQVAPPTKASPDVALRSQTTVAPKAINPRPTTTARPTIQRASRPPAYVGSNGQSRSFSAPPRHARYGNTYYGSRPYRSGGSDYYPVYGGSDVLLWMVVADAMSDNGERRINCEYPANATDQRICDDARRDAARQVGATNVAAPVQTTNPLGWILGTLAAFALIGGGLWFFLRGR